ncbi:MAG TPA: hypothetical protein VGH74_22845 [Planctomycetaceae bacterium]
MSVAARLFYRRATIAERVSGENRLLKGLRVPFFWACLLTAAFDRSG